MDFTITAEFTGMCILIVEDKLRIPDPIEANRVAAGGLLVSYGKCV
ncbi:MAG: hypothetical protein U5K71_03340 [Gracilimonas sp.]|nr:hypothetical protein [Gracilimonas sp.]